MTSASEPYEPTPSEFGPSEPTPSEPTPYQPDTYDLAQAQAAPDVLGRPEREPGRRPGRAKLALIAGGAVLCVGVAGGAVYATSVLSGGGAQPEDVLPGNAIGFVKVDLDPAAGQKIAAYRLAKKFPDSGVQGQDSLQADLVHTLLDGNDEKDYDAHVQPWLGKRAGIAFLAPSARQPDEPVVVAAVQYTDKAKAKAGLDALAGQAGTRSDQVRYAFAPDADYVLLGQDQESVDAASRTPSHLADAPSYSRGVTALGGDQVALGWLDLGALWKALPADARRQAADTSGLELSGLAVLGLHVADDAVEVVGRTIDVSAGSSPAAQRLLATSFGRAGGSQLLQAMPADSMAGVQVNGLGSGLAELYQNLGSRSIVAQIRSATRDLGVELPGDLPALFGTEAAVAVGGDVAAGRPQVRLSVRSASPGRALDILAKGRDLAAKDDPGAAAQLSFEHTQGGYSAAYGAPAHAPAGELLGSSDVFRRTLPDAATSGLSYYVDLQRALAQFAPPGGKGGPTAQQRRNLEPLQAVGYTAGVDQAGNATFRLRLTVRR